MKTYNDKMLRENIYKYRNLIGLSHEEISRKSKGGISASYFGEIEIGKKQPSMDKLYAISDALGISIDSLFENNLEYYNHLNQSEPDDTILKLLNLLPTDDLIKIIRITESLVHAMQISK